MANLHLRMRVLASALVVAGAWVGSAPAEAAVYKGTWDPPYDAGPSSPMPDLGWSGEAEFKIEDTCLSSLGGSSFSGWVNNVSAVCAGQLSITSALVTLSDLNGTYDDVKLSYGSASSPGTNGSNIPTVLLLSMYLEQGNVTAVNGGFWLPERVSASTAPFAVVANSKKNYTAAAYWLGFSGSENNLTNPPSSAQARLASCSYSKSFLFECSANNNDLSKATMSISVVPEPEAYLMGLMSLAVIGVWSRRRRPVPGPLTAFA